MIEPSELAAIKASVAVTAEDANSRGCYLGSLEILDAIDRGAADAAARRVIMFDCETGEELMPSNAATGPIRDIMAAQLLPGTTPEQIAEFYTSAMDDDPRPFIEGRRVESLEVPPLKGTISRRVETDGELHTVMVVWDGHEGAQAYSPRELKEVQR